MSGSPYDAGWHLGSQNLVPIVQVRRWLDDDHLSRRQSGEHLESIDQFDTRTHDPHARHTRLRHHEEGRQLANVPHGLRGNDKGYTFVDRSTRASKKPRLQIRMLRQVDLHEKGMRRVVDGSRDFRNQSSDPKNVRRSDRPGVTRHHHVDLAAHVEEADA
jgi:hypothetical protein